MRISGIIWLDEIIDKLEVKHAIQPHEVAEVLEGAPWFRLSEQGHRPGENVYAAFDQTTAGRYLIVFFVYKQDKRALVISAREMTARERTTYERR